MELIIKLAQIMLKLQRSSFKTKGAKITQMIFECERVEIMEENVLILILKKRN